MTERNEELISGKAFPSVNVYGLETKGRPIIAVRFGNTEERETWKRFLGVVAMASPSFSEFSKPTSFKIMMTWIFTVVVWGYYNGMTEKIKYRREILLDFENNRLVVTRRGLLRRKAITEIVQPLDGPAGLHSLTIEPHIEAENERIRRGGRLGIKQKLHCLVGWFGPKGAVRRTLVNRYEWPSATSLFEVRQATEWALELGKNFGKAIRAADDGAGSAQTPPTIKPPLD